MDQIQRLAPFFEAHHGAIIATVAAVFGIFIVLMGAANRRPKVARQPPAKAERAYVFLDNFYPDISLQRGAEVRFTRFVIRLLWRNNGSGAAKNMVVSVNWTSLPSDSLPHGAKDEYDDRFRVEMSLGPEATEWSTPIVIPPDTATRAWHGEERIFIWGRVDYEDACAETAPHFTRWCYRLQFDEAVDPRKPQFIAISSDHIAQQDSRTL